MTASEGGTADVAEDPREPGPLVVSVALLAKSGRLFAAHWWELLAVAALAFVAHHYLMQLAIVVGRAGAAPGMLLFALVPFSTLAGLTVMLLLLRRRQGARGGAALLAAVGSVLIPYLVVYESTGALLRDLGTFFNLGFADDQGRAGAATGDLGGDVDFTYRIPEPTSPLVIGIVAAAVLLRAVGTKLVAREERWRGRPRGLRFTLQAVVGYTEVVWIVLGAVVVRAVLGAAQGWWLERRAGAGLLRWWDSSSTPEILRTVVEGAVAAGGVLLDGAVTGILVPIAWLCIGVIVYGLQAADTISERQVLAAVERQRVVRNVGTGRSEAVALAWRRIADPEGRFGALLGGLVMIVRAGFAPVLVFCIAYQLVNTLVPYLVWGVARGVLPQPTRADWLAVYDPVEAVSQILALILSTALVAAFADGLLARYGARSSLRLAGGRPRRRAATAAASAGAPEATSASAAASGPDDEQPGQSTSSRR